MKTIEEQAKEAACGSTEASFREAAAFERGYLAAAAPREELIAELVEALKEAAEMIRSEYCSHPGPCGPQVNSCYAGCALSALAKAEARQ